MEINKEKDNVFAGIAWMVLTGLMFVAVTGIVRHVGSEIPAAQAAFIRYLFGLIIVLPFLSRMFLKKRSIYTSLFLH